MNQQQKASQNSATMASMRGKAPRPKLTDAQLAGGSRLTPSEKMNLAALRTLAAQTSPSLATPEQITQRLAEERARRSRLRREEYEAAHRADMLEECAAWGIPQTSLGVYLLEHFFPARLPNGRLVWLNFCAPKNRYPFDVCLTASTK